jgi:hypothetical protein
VNFENDEQRSARSRTTTTTTTTIEVQKHPFLLVVYLRTSFLKTEIASGPVPATAFHVETILMLNDRVMLTPLPPKATKLNHHRNHQQAC